MMGQAGKDLAAPRDYPGMRTNCRVLTLLVLLALQPLSCARTDAESIDGGAGALPNRWASPKRSSVPSSRCPKIGRADPAVVFRSMLRLCPRWRAWPKPDPLVLLAGGPGQAASSLGPWVGSVFAPIRRQRDIVLVDQRGTGSSHALRCAAASADAAEPLVRREERASRACLRRSTPIPVITPTAPRWKISRTFALRSAMPS